ncbi:MAG: M17 family metallopeptidase [Geminicoccaceae bacterium]
MLTCLTVSPDEPTRTLHVITNSAYQSWLAKAPATWRAWLVSRAFDAKGGACALLPDADGRAEHALGILSDPAEIWDFAAFREALPNGQWRIDGDIDDGQAALGWALGDYEYCRYREPDERMVALDIAQSPAVDRAQSIGEAILLARDLVNMPANELGPEQLSRVAEDLAAQHGAWLNVTVGDDLLAGNLPLIHAVGRASENPPRLIDIRWGELDAPRLTLVGKGVCFDTGGLDLKPSNAMLLMKKDMGGAAIMLALAKAIMLQRWPVRLRVLIPAVENSVSGAAFRPGDVLKARDGSYVEIGNTDAEGRLILADALSLALEDTPDVICDAATLTGAARVALGPDMPALFTNDDALAAAIAETAVREDDPVWRLPLHTPYLKMLESSIADINNAGSGGFAGAITAALFLQRFAKDAKSWCHMDVYAWNQSARPGRPKGGEAQGLRALFSALEDRFTGESGQ